MKKLLGPMICCCLILAACSDEFDYVEVTGSNVRTMHDLKMSFVVPERFSLLGEANFSEAYGGPTFNISTAAFTDDSTLASVHAEQYADGSGGLDYGEMPADTLAGIPVNAGIGCFDLRSETPEDIAGNGFLTLLSDSGFSFDRAFVLKRFFLTNAPGTAEVVLSYGIAVDRCVEEGVTDEMALRVSEEARAAFASLQAD